MPLWWERNDLAYDSEGFLLFAGQRAADLARASGAPAFFYSRARALAKMQTIRSALDMAELARHTLFYAMKANRFMPLLTGLAESRLCGVDVCSPAEITRALACGFREEDISFTGTSVSEADLDIICRHPGIMLNCDSQSMLRRVAARKVFRRVGLRINPAIGVGYGNNQLLAYSGKATTKFGIYAEQFDETIRLAGKLGLEITRIHFHTGCGYLRDQLPVFENILKECAAFIAKLPGIEAINIGGGLGVRLTESDRELDLDEWAAVIKRQLGDFHAEIHAEPGDAIIKDAGILVLEVNTVEKKKDTLFVGVNGGFNIACEPAYYSMPSEVAPLCLRAPKEEAYAKCVPVTIAGNINEALDIWYRDIPLPELREGDKIALLNSGGYAGAMSSNHCMRGAFTERLLL